MKPRTRALRARGQRPRLRHALPYHGPFITREMIIAQFKISGLRSGGDQPVHLHSATCSPSNCAPMPRSPERKMGSCSASSRSPKAASSVHDLKSLPPTPGVCGVRRVAIPPKSTCSRTAPVSAHPHHRQLAHLLRTGAPRRRQMMYDGLKNKDDAKIKAAHELYEKIIPKERAIE